MQEVRRKLFARVRHSVCSKLFLAKPTFCQHLVEINHFVSDISQVKMSYCNSNHLYQLEEYSDLQVVTREQKAKPALESTSEKVQQVSAYDCMCLLYVLLLLLALCLGALLHDSSNTNYSHVRVLPTCQVCFSHSNKFVLNLKGTEADSVACHKQEISCCRSSSECARKLKSKLAYIRRASETLQS